MVSDLILDVHLVSKDGGDYCVRCPHCGDIIGIDGQDLSEIRGEQFHHKRREYPGPNGPRFNGCGGWLEVSSTARFVRELPAVPSGVQPHAPTEQKGGA